MTKQIFSPYRICPIGAHVDHQGGVMLGQTIQCGTTLTYKPSTDRQFYITSAQFGEARFSIDDKIDHTHWARYAQAAACVFGDQIKRGIQAHVSGELIGAGISSSASVGLAYLKAIADANDIALNSEQLVQLDYQLESHQLGLEIGLLDPLTIVYGKKSALLFIESLIARATCIENTPGNDSVWIVAYSGMSRELTKSGFNTRVNECYQAARLLKDGAKILSDVPREVFEEKKMNLPQNLRNRAEHYFGEVERVRRGAQAWKDVNPELFGELMLQSCQSSIHNYEVGSPILIELHQITSSTKGIYGSRFSGGGYAGSVVALAKKDQAESATLEIAERFSRLHPELHQKVFVAETGDGLQ